MKKRKKGDKFWNKPYINDGGHNSKTGFMTKEVLDTRIDHSKLMLKRDHAKKIDIPFILKSGYVWSIKKQKFVMRNRNEKTK